MNENCLEGIRCPKCGHEDQFGIGGWANFTVNDDGIEEMQDSGWDDDSIIVCASCDHQGTVAEFTISNQKETVNAAEQD